MNMKSTKRKIITPKSHQLLNGLSEMPSGEQGQHLHVSVKKTNNAHIVLHSEELGEISWPLSKSPENLKSGESLHLKLTRPEENQMEQLRKLLEELVG